MNSTADVHRLAWLCWSECRTWHVGHRTRAAVGARASSRSPMRSGDVRGQWTLRLGGDGLSATGMPNTRSYFKVSPL